MNKKWTIIGTIVVSLIAAGSSLYFSSNGMRRVNIFNRASVVTGGRQTKLENARITLTGPSSVERGSTITVKALTNYWAHCTGSLNPPVKKAGDFLNGTAIEFTQERPGVENWIWNVPTDAEKGHWTVVGTCGVPGNTEVKVKGIDVR